VCGCRLGDGFENVGLAEDVADVDPEDEVFVVGVGDAVGQIGDPPFRIDLDGIKQLEAVNQQGNLGEGFEIDGPRNFGTPVVDCVHDDSHGVCVESARQLEVNPAIGLPYSIGAGELQFGMEHARCQREVPRRDFYSQA
jgi:hypothetical protein